ncbi:hypothetical protein LAZ67_14000030 [Cordylochernes scorpioides]|uniref:Uncharacterized protein n=1 Tax=Cordylochernes scorpioides TaxID=51811 RepID=A0ABY6L647_9ARAC|nr:hypothetical protein LAZ67_14000024 [Cordylochernes scorpioides]UYV76329.1 hypothetical protein LAZ67_14000030 [Cordylochernes scorpioides]
MRDLRKLNAYPYCRDLLEAFTDLRKKAHEECGCKDSPRETVCQAQTCAVALRPPPAWHKETSKQPQKSSQNPWTDMVTNNQVLDRMGTERQLIKFIKQRKLTFAGHVMCGSAGETLLTVLEGKLQGKRSRGRRRRGYTDDLKQ